MQLVWPQPVASALRENRPTFDQSDIANVDFPSPKEARATFLYWEFNAIYIDEYVLK